MHMADALIAPAVGGVMYAASAAAAAWSVNGLRREEDPRKIPMMGVMGALVFAVQMLNFTIPGTGSSGHLCGGMMLSAVLGPGGGFLTMIGVLVVQCLLFADGGILALGANIWNMAFYGCFVGSLLIWRPMMKRGASRGRIVAASIIGCVVTLQLGSFSVALQTLVSGITALPFSTFVGFMQPIHLAIGTIEGLITASVLLFVHEARPELLWGVQEVGDSRGRLSYRATAVAIVAAAAIAGGLISLYASEHPDGLEWSVERVTAGTEIEPESESAIYASMEELQSRTALLPDYGFKSDADDEGSAAGTSLSGIVGGAAVIVLCVALCKIFGLYVGTGRRKRTA